MTGKELAKSDFVGIWKDRDIEDSVDFVNELRGRIERRERVKKRNHIKSNSFAI